jgi:hypothetical protein
MFKRLGSDPRVLLQWLAALLVMVALQGCAPVRLVGDYDEHIDQGVTALQHDTDAFIESLDPGADAPVVAYADNHEYYDKARVAISGLRVRADAIERNSLTVQMLDNLRNGVNLFEQAHRRGGLTAMQLGRYQKGFNRHFTSLLTFELQKRRTREPDIDKATVAPTKVRGPGEADVPEFQGNDP